MHFDQCGNKQSINAKYCHVCGALLIKSIDDAKPKQTMANLDPEEYRKTTNIKSVDQAREYLHNLNVFFVIIPLWWASGLILASMYDFGGLYWIVNIVLAVCFFSYSSKVIKAEKISKANAFLSIIFSPISWVWFYPAITKPLKIIIGPKLHSQPNIKNNKIKIIPSEQKDYIISNFSIYKTIIYVTISLVLFILFIVFIFLNFA